MIKKSLIIILGLFLLISIVAGDCPEELKDSSLCSGGDSGVEISSNKFACSIQNDGAYWIKGNNKYSIPEEEDCYKEEGDVDGITSCCPSGSICDLASGNCDVGNNGAGFRYCSDYGTQPQCNSDVANVAERSVELSKNEEFCSTPFKKNNNEYFYRLCGCYWENGKCRAGWEEFDVNNNLKGNCTLNGTLDESNCESSGLAHYEWTASWNNGGESTQHDCEGGNSNIPCNQLTQLPFFGLINFVIALGVLIIFYGVIIKKNENNKN